MEEIKEGTSSNFNQIKESENQHQKLEKPKQLNTIAQKKQKLKDWIKQPANFMFIIIFIFAIAIRLYYFILTKSQPLWWDESDYMAYAKNLAGFSVDWVVTGGHSSVFPYFVAFFFKLGFSEIFVKFFIEFLPSVLIVLLTYKICILMYKDKRVALITSFLMATFWAILFNSMRFHLELPALFFGFLAIYVFWQGYEKKQKIFGFINYHWAIPFTVFFVVLTYATRRGYFLFGLFFLFYMLFTRNFKELIKDKYNWIALFVFLGLFFFIELFIFPEFIGTTATSIYIHPEQPMNLSAFQVFSLFFNNIFNNFHALFYIFYLGAVIIIFNIVISIGDYKKNQENEIKSDLFVFLMVALVLGFFILSRVNLAEVGEPRWYFPLLLGSLIFISKGTLFISDYLKKYNKILSIIVIILLIGYGGYYEFQHADMIIKSKLNSFNGIKQAGLFLKENSSPDDMIMSIPKPQLAYYAERSIVTPSIPEGKLEKESTFEEFIAELKKPENEKVKYIVVSFSEPNHPSWMKQEEIIQNPQTGQIMYSKWIIPFTQTSIDFVTGEQKIPSSASYGDVEFKLVNIFEDVFLYKVIH